MTNVLLFVAWRFHVVVVVVVVAAPKPQLPIDFCVHDEVGHLDDGQEAGAEEQAQRSANIA